jgi:hypothetical protein
MNSNALIKRRERDNASLEPHPITDRVSEFIHVRSCLRSFIIAQRLYLSGNLNDCNLLAIHKIDGVFLVKIYFSKYMIYLFKHIIFKILA